MRQKYLGELRPCVKQSLHGKTESWAADLKRKKQQLFRLKTPWHKSYESAKDRCVNKKNNRYKNYGGKGVKFKMTLNDFKTLWFRDKAYYMITPSIDRIDSNGNYEISNCRFLEHRDNAMRVNPAKKIVQMDLSGIKICTWESGSILMKVLGIDSGSLHKCLYHKKYSRLGYRFIFESEYIKELGEKR